jgi:fatty acid desaturase
MTSQSDVIHLQREWLEPSDLYGWKAMLRNTLPLFALLWLAPVLADHNTLAPWLLSPIIGLFVYRITVVMHDCTHYTLFKGLRSNKVIGSLLGAISGVDFRSFSTQHWRHHRSYGKEDDPQGFHYIGMAGMMLVEFRWHLIKPLLGLNLRNTFAESMLAPRNLGRIFWSGELALVVLVQFLILAVVTGLGRHPVLAVLPVFSAATFGLFFSQLRGIAEHGAVGNCAEAGNVRSHATNFLDRIFLYDLNFNYHKEHHEHPQVPSCHLPAIHKLTAKLMSGTPKSMFDTLCAIHSGMRSSSV